MGELRIDTEALNRDVSAMRSCLTRLTAELDGMFQALMTLNRMWEGPANASFDQQFRADATDMRELCSIISALAGCMETAEREYRRCGEKMDSAVAAVSL